MELAPGERAPEDTGEGKDGAEHDAQNGKVEEKVETDEEKAEKEDIRLGSPVLCQRVNGVEMAMI